MTKKKPTTKSDWVRIGDNAYMLPNGLVLAYDEDDNEWFVCNCRTVEWQYVRRVFATLGISPLPAKAKRKAKR